MQIRCGTDIIMIDRIEKAVARQGQAFVDRIWTSSEQQDCVGAGRFASLAARFAAKEAAAKALGTGIGPSGVSWHDFEVRKLPSGQPELKLHGAAATLSYSLGAVSHSLSLSHDGGQALAFCVILCNQGENN
ncbi:MAG: holo-ACP synthase [Clostridiaceae bacterium]|nr:holo-ACP synthase [Clostridiaceae bacterium]